MILLILLALLIALLAVVFALQNATMVTITFLAWQFQGSLALLLLLTLAVGFLIGWLAAMPSVVRHRLDKSGLRKQIAALQETLEEERTRLAVVSDQLKEDISESAERPPKNPS